jgi:hypothetical protein
MPKSRPPYPPELRQQMIELVRGGRTPEELAEELEPSVQTTGFTPARASPRLSNNDCLWILSGTFSRHGRARTETSDLRRPAPGCA